jgi:hypothetical protein
MLWGLEHNDNETLMKLSLMPVIIAASWNIGLSFGESLMLIMFQWVCIESHCFGDAKVISAMSFG